MMICVECAAKAAGAALVYWMIAYSVSYKYIEMKHRRLRRQRQVGK
jgi:hypothetical protein